MNETQRQLQQQSDENTRPEGWTPPSDQDTAEGKRAYAAYQDGAGDVTSDGRAMPAWDDLGDRQRAGWITAARVLRSGQ